MQMSKEQQKFAEENHNLIYFFLKRRQLEVEEYYGIAADGYCRAVITYDADRGKFSTYAMVCMQTAISREWQMRNRKSIIKPEVLFYYDATLPVEESKETFLDQISDPTQCCEEWVVAITQCESVLKTMSAREVKIIKLIHHGHSQVQIAQWLGVSPSAVSQVKRRFIRKYTATCLE